MTNEELHDYLLENIPTLIDNTTQLKAIKAMLYLRPERAIKIFNNDFSSIEDYNYESKTIFTAIDLLTVEYNNDCYSFEQMQELYEIIK